MQGNEYFHIDIFETDLMELEENDFWEVWAALGKVIRIRAKKWRETAK